MATIRGIDGGITSVSRYRTPPGKTSQSGYFTPNSACNYLFPNDLASNGNLFGAKSIGEV